MKKIVGIMAVAAMATSMFAADIAAHVQFWGTLAEGNKGSKSVSLLTLDDSTQKDTDALIFTVNGDKAGAMFKMYYTSPATDGSAVVARAAQIWVAPVDGVKVAIGNVEDDGLYKERNHWWKVPTGTSAAQSASWEGRWSSYAAVSGYGALATVTAVPKLTVQAGIATGTNVADGTFTLASAGAVAKYQILDNLSAGASYRYSSSFDVAAIGADFGSWGTPYYGFVQARFCIDDYGNNWWSVKENKKLAGIAIDNYFKYATGALTVQAAAPVVIRGIHPDAVKADDPSYMQLDVKVTYGLDGYTPYLTLGTPGNVASSHGEGDFAVWTFDSNMDPALEVRPGVTFNVGAASFDFGAALIFTNKFQNMKWSVPFSVGLGF